MGERVAPDFDSRFGRIEAAGVLYARISTTGVRALHNGNEQANLTTLCAQSLFKRLVKVMKLKARLRMRAAANFNEGWMWCRLWTRWWKRYHCTDRTRTSDEHSTRLTRSWSAAAVKTTPTGSSCRGPTTSACPSRSTSPYRSHAATGPTPAHSTSSVPRPCHANTSTEWRPISTDAQRLWPISTGTA